MRYPSPLYLISCCFFFFNDTATTEIYTLSLHDALPISGRIPQPGRGRSRRSARTSRSEDRKSTRLNSSHHGISYAVFCLKKKKSKQLRVANGKMNAGDGLCRSRSTGE